MQITNQLKKYVKSLHANKHRQKYNKFIAEGPKVVEEFLLSNKYALEYIFCLTDWYETHRQLLDNIPSSKLYLVKAKELSQISTLKTPNKVLLVMDRRTSENTDISSGWSLYLDRVQDPGNMGTILRIADWYGVPQVIASEGCADFFNPKVVQAAMGAHNRVLLKESDSSVFFTQFKGTKYGLTLDGKNINEMTSVVPGLIIIGNESQGIDQSLLSSIDYKIKIPRLGGAESLNASVACGIACHQLLTTKS